MSAPRLPRSHAREFVPALLAVQQTPPSPLPRAVLYLLLGLLAAIGLFCCFGELDIIALAEGRLVPRTYVKIVQPAEGGVLQAILVDEGDRVPAGQVLLRMDAKLSQADTRILKADRARLMLQLRRIDAELADAEFSPSDAAGDEATAQRGQIRAQFQAHRRAYEDERATELAARAKTREERAAAIQIRRKLEALLPTYRQEEAALDGLEARHLAATLDLLARRRKRIEAEQDLNAQIATLQSLEAAVAQSDRRLAQIESRYRERLSNERVETQAQLDRVIEDLAKQEHRNALLELRAPQAGIVKDLATHTVGAVISPGTILMTLVPSDETLQAEVVIRNEDIGFVRTGQPAKVKLAAYPFQKYGVVEGRVVHVSADASEAATEKHEMTAGARESDARAGYKALVALDAQALVRGGERHPLAPGMQITAEINQGKRTVLEYLLSPLQGALAEAGRER